MCNYRTPAPSAPGSPLNGSPVSSRNTPALARSPSKTGAKSGALLNAAAAKLSNSSSSGSSGSASSITFMTAVDSEQDGGVAGVPVKINLLRMSLTDDNSSSTRSKRTSSSDSLQQQHSKRLSPTASTSMTAAAAAAAAAVAVKYDTGANGFPTVGGASTEGLRRSSRVPPSMQPSVPGLSVAGIQCVTID
jgi:hypothetical protein